MLKGTWRTEARVVGIRGSAVGASSFETSVYAQFWRDASKAVAMSRRGKVHLISKVDMAVLRALHDESVGQGSAGKMPIVVVCRDYESLAGPMMRGIKRTEAGWLMGDQSIVKFFSDVPGSEEGVLVEPRVVEVSREVQSEMAQLEEVMRARARSTAEGTGLTV